MSYRLTSNRGRRNPWRLLMNAFAIIVLLVIIDLFFWWPIDRVVQYIASPILNSHNIFSDNLGKLFAYFDSKVSLEEQNKKLQERVDLLTLDSLNTKVLTQENQELKATLGRNIAEQDIVLSVVLLKPSFSPYDTLIVDAGNDMGVSVGDKAFAQEVPLGTVVEVYPHSSMIKLYSSPGQTFQAFVGTSSIMANVEGQGGGNFFIKLPKDASVAEGDPVTMPGIYPHTFALISKVISTAGDSFKQIYFRSPVSMYSLKWVQIEKQHGNR